MEKNAKNNFRDLFESEYLDPVIEWFGDQIPGGFFIYRAAEPYEMIYVNKGVRRIFGCKTLEEFKKLTGYTFRGIVHPEDFERIQNFIDSQIADEENENQDYVEYRITRKDGIVRWVGDYGHLANLPGYGDVYFVFIGDITEKYQEQEERRRRVNVYAGMMEQLNAFADEALTVFRANVTTGVMEEARGRDLFNVDYPGGSFDACIQAREESFLLDSDRAQYQEIFASERLVDRYYEGEGPTTFVGYCKRQSGRQCFVQFSGSAVVDPVTRDVMTFGTETEFNAGRVTEILNEKVLARQFDMVCYIMGDYYGVVIGDPANLKRGNVFPKKRDGIYEEYVREQIMPVAVGTQEELETLRRALSLEAVAEGLSKADSYTVDLVCKIDGEEYNKRFRYYTVDEEAKFFILLKSDLTEDLRKERERSQLLADALQEAERANAAKTRFLSNMSHEIRTPMNAIIGLNSLALNDGALSEGTRKYLEKIGDSAKHLLGLINDILDMSRIEAGRMTVRQEEFSFRAMLEQICTMVTAQCDDKGLQFECRVIGQMDDYYVGDDMKLKQVLINILSNAIKFTDAPGNVLLTVERTASFGDRSTLKFVVKDSGIGMEKEFLPKIFDAFAQEDTSRINKYGSTGLGMAITKSIVEMMNGSIFVESEKGVGSEFTVVLTLKNCEHHTAEAGSDERKRADLKGRHVLLAEDILINAEIMKELIAMREAEIDHAENGKIAVETFEKSPEGYYDAILMDIRMPEMDGLQAAAAIRALKRADAQRIPMIALTANAFDEDVQRSLQVGMNAHLSKPVEPERLYQTLEELIYEADAKKEPLRLEHGRHKCPCCGCYVLESAGKYEICPVCYWEDDPLQESDPDLEGGANKLSLKVSRENYQRFGACEERFRKNVRRPLPEEMGDE